MKDKNIFNLFGIMYFVLFFFLGIISEFTNNIKDKTFLIFLSFLFLLIAFWYFIQAKKEKD